MHRDLKPGNVLLGRFGETLVADWGLARLIDRVVDPELKPEEPTLRPIAADTIDDTEIGSVIGTIGFMPPEQAEGRHDELGPASDVYSLGAILYAILTGRASIRSGDAPDRSQAIRDIVTGNFPQPRAVNPKVPRPLEAVCLKAMATQPADRYAAPAALANDIKHWLADEPVAAYPEPWTQRLARWIRRHRVWAQAAAAALVLVTLVSTVAAVAVSRSYENERRARAQSVADLLTARESAIATYKFASRDLAALANSEPLRERLASQVVATYDSLIKKSPADQSLRRAAALAEREVANMCRLQGKTEPASAAYDRALARLHSLIAEFPANEDARDELAQTMTDQAALLRTRGRLAEAQAVLGQALELARRRTTKAADAPAVTRTEAYCLLTLASVQVEAGRVDEALRSSQQALHLWKAIAANPRANEAVDPLALIVAHAQVGAARRERGDRAGARTAFDTALELAEQRGAKHPNNSDTVEKRGSARNALGDFLEDTEPTRAIELFRGAIVDLTVVARSRSRVPAFRHELAVAYRGLGSAFLAAGKPGEAATYATQARNILRALILERELPGYHYSLGRTLALQAGIARAQRKLDNARGFLVDAIAEHDRAIAVNPLHELDYKHRQKCRDELQKLPENPVPAPGAGTAVDKHAIPH
jgi:serine/threonine-protein kinase